MKLFKNTSIAAESLESSKGTHIHEPPNWAFIIIVVAVTLFLLLWAIERWLVRLLADLGFSHPNTVFAMLIWLLILGLPATLFVNRLMHGWVEAKHRHHVELERIRLDQLTQQHLLQQSVVADSRALKPEDKDLVALVTAIMTDYYLKGEYTSQGFNPWARRNAGSFILPGQNTPVGQGSNVVREAVRWLRKNRVIFGDPGKETVNLKDYPNLAAIQRQLHQPAVLVAPYPALPDNVLDPD